MNTHRSTWLILAVLVLSVLTAGLTMWRYYDSLNAPAGLSEDTLRKITNDFRLKNKALATLIIINSEYQKIPAELRDPNGVIPDPSRYDREKLSLQLKAGAECRSIPGRDAQARKLAAWFAFRCKQAANLDPSVWRTTPFLHPLGGSWAYWLKQNGFGSEDWLAQEKAYLHVLEWRHLPSKALTPDERILSDLNPISLYLMNSGMGLFVTEKYVFIAPMFEPTRTPYHIYARAEWEKELARQNLAQSAIISSACELKLFGQCWNYKSHTDKDPTRYFLTMSGAVGALTLVLLLSVYFRARSEKRLLESQQLVIQTLAHELRQPVTGLKLAMDSVRMHYDDFNEAMKRDFFRLTTITERMNRLVGMSQQYLKLMASEREFTFRRDRVESMNAFIEQTLERFEKTVHFKKNPADTACVFDAYWVATCVTNLLTNGLNYGQAPVTIDWRREGDDLYIVVSDGGPGPKQSLEDLLKPRFKESAGGGLGLGLSLVHRLARLMGGALTFASEPTRFTLYLRGACRV